MQKYLQKYLAEFIGTLIFVSVILVTGNPWAIGAALALVIWLTASISGGHMNPAVSLVMASSGKLSTADVIPYIIAQISGGLLALAIYKKWKI
jgi:glycerol uptake facilitator-like aquaporin